MTGPTITPHIRVRALLGSAAVLAALTATPVTAQATRRVTINPYVEASQTLAADLNGGDVLTYSSLAAGVDAAIQTQQISGQLSYRYEHRFGWGDALGDDDIHSGLARAHALAVRHPRCGAWAARRQREQCEPSLLGLCRPELCQHRGPGRV
jgi:hypothetical protein